MMVVRPIKASDLDALKYMAENAGVGFTSLPANIDLLKNKIAEAEKAFQPNIDPEHNQSYLFVLEDLSNKKIAGVCGIESALGLDSPWYNYHLGTLVHASPSLNVYGKSRTLTLSNDHTGCSELCTLFLDQDYRHSKNGSLLSKSRFMFIANQPNRFNSRIIAEMRGVSDSEGQSPFWDGLGAHFFSMPFAKADYLSGLGNKAFIAELMPKLPIYINLMSESVQAVIGKVHDNTLPALRMLESEGFQNLGYVDIFDGGPTIEAHIHHVRAINESNLFTVKIVSDSDFSIRSESSLSEASLISNQGVGSYACMLATVDLSNKTDILLNSEMASALGVKEGELVRAVAVSAKKRF